MKRKGSYRNRAVLAATSFAAAAALFAQGAAAQTLLNPAQVQQFRNTLPNPLDPAFIWQPDGITGNTYTLEIRETLQNLGLDQFLNLNTTRVWAYGKAGQAPTFPGRTFEVQRGTPITVSYVNKLTDLLGRPIPNRMPVDATLDWAAPGAVGGITPVPVVAHLHGGDSQYLSDGLPDAWGTPCAEIPAPRACRTALVPQQGRLYSKPYTYENTQEAGTLWYHDHALGITRTNVYMGLAGFYILRDQNENALRSAPMAMPGAAPVLPSHPYEIPIVIQDREFTLLRQLFYPSGAADLNGNPIANSHLPEFFGRVILANGKAWPKMNVEPRKYRLRLLNGSDSRFYDLRFEYFAANAPVVPGTGTSVPMLVVGTELGLLDSPATPSLDTPVGGVRPGTPNVLPIGPGERYDVVVDFSGVPAGSRVVVTNSANSPYPDAAPPDAGLNDRLMAFDVNLPMSATPDATVAAGTDLRDPDLGTPNLGALPTDLTKIPVRRIMLYEGLDKFGRLQTMLGPIDKDPISGLQGTQTFKDPITEHPAFGSTEVWEFYNTTVDAHPIHMHLVDFRVINREGFTAALADKPNTTDGSLGAIVTNLDGTLADVPNSIVLDGNVVAPSAHEAGKKDTVKAFPGEVTRVLVSFNRKGEYVYHCHILSHEDHEMMRPYTVH
jgi:spore coat protein A